MASAVSSVQQATSRKAREVAHPSYFSALASNPRDTYAPQMLATRQRTSLSLTEPSLLSRATRPYWIGLARVTRSVAGSLWPDRLHKTFCERVEHSANAQQYVWFHGCPLVS